MKKIYLAKAPGNYPYRKISELEDLRQGDLIETIELPSYIEVPIELEMKMYRIIDDEGIAKAVDLFIERYNLPNNTIIQAEIIKLMGLSS